MGVSCHWQSAYMIHRSDICPVEPAVPVWGGASSLIDHGRRDMKIRHRPLKGLPEEGRHSFHRQRIGNTWGGRQHWHGLLGQGR